GAKNEKKSEKTDDEKSESRIYTARKSDGVILTEKANVVGRIVDAQIAKLKKMQKNAINGDKVKEYNKMLEMYSAKLIALQIDEKTVISESDGGFDFDSIEIETEE
ncbi:unnamed protein product, partial [marine sediment metagenome]